MYGNIDQIVAFGDKWYSKILMKIHISFLAKCTEGLNALVKMQKPKNNSEKIRNCTILTFRKLCHFFQTGTREVFTW